MAITDALGQGRSGVAGDAGRGRIGVAAFAAIAAQLVLVLLVLRQFQIEGKTFVLLAAATFVAFAVHAFLPLRWRLPFFAAFSVAALGVVLGAANAAWIVAVGALLVAICHLPLSWRWRSALLLAVASVLMAQRSGWLPAPWSDAIWPILGSIFMFRLIVYAYDLRHDKTPVTAAQTVGYFAMVPNACFPLFPVIDFKTWRRSHYAVDARATYQRGIDWIVRGVVHLLLYRYVYHQLTLSPAEVRAPADLLQYLVSNFLLYLRVSGLFHLVVGVLHLFGFHLPETHHRYLLASSFTDFWRRINIYWKDFMQKLFYYPAVFALKRFGANRAVVLATLYVFLLTWFLHSYQWFWLRGSWLFEPQDVLFWSILGVLVVVNSLYEIRYGRNRKLGTARPRWRTTLLTAAKTYAMFWLICVLWAFWTADSISSWLSLWPALGGPYTIDALLFPALALAVIVLGSVSRHPDDARPTPEQARRQASQERMATVAMAAALLVVSVEAVHVRLGPTIASTIHSLRTAQLSRLDNAKLERGYYENLLDVNRFNSQLWEVYSKRPTSWLAVDFTGLKRFTDGFAQYELVSSSVSPSQYGAITTNRHGMRDRDYAATRAPGTLRIAVLGASSVMGWGVADDDTFEALLEARLAREPLATGFERVELLNFGVPGYQPPQQLANFERALALQPNALFYVATGREQGRSAAYMAEVVRKRVPIPNAELKALVEQAGVDPSMDEADMLRRLEPLSERILEVVYRTIADRARAKGVAPVWVFLPQLSEGTWQRETPQAQRLAQLAGFEIVGLDGVFPAAEYEKLRLAEWDEHPNTLAHRRIADRLYAEIGARPGMFRSAAP